MIFYSVNKAHDKTLSKDKRNANHIHFDVFASNLIFLFFFFQSRQISFAVIIRVAYPFAMCRVSVSFCLSYSPISYTLPISLAMIFFTFHIAFYYNSFFFFYFFLKRYTHEGITKIPTERIFFQP